MIQLQCISKVINTGDLTLITSNNLDVEYFTGYEDEYNFLIDHFKTYGNVPDAVTFKAKFPEFEIVDCTESDQYILDTIREEHLYMKCVPIIQKSAELLKSDSNVAVEYLMSSVKNLELTNVQEIADIASDEAVQKRREEYIKRRDNPNDYFFTTGFEELDNLINFIQRFEELLVIVARTNIGKSWILEKIASHIWQLGFNVGYISPEMGEMSIGYRFDSLISHLSNMKMMKGSKDFDLDEFDTHAEKIHEHTNKFLTAIPKNFNNLITISKLRTFVETNDLHALFIDGITYLSDERREKGDTVSQMLTHISEDLMTLSIELKIPVIIVAQANRQAVGVEEAPGLETIRDSDGIGYNASKVLGLLQDKETHELTISVKKGRGCPVGVKVKYAWDIDTGKFTFLSSGTSNTSSKNDETMIKHRKKNQEPQSEEDMF